MFGFLAFRLAATTLAETETLTTRREIGTTLTCVRMPFFVLVTGRGRKKAFQVSLTLTRLAERMEEEEDDELQDEIWGIAEAMPDEAMERLVDQVMATDDFDGSDMVAVANRMDVEEAFRKGNVSWEELALQRSEQKVFRDLGVENPAKLKKRIDYAAELGAPIDPEDVEQLKNFTEAGENPIMNALGQDSASLEHLVRTSRAFYEIARQLPDEDSKGPPMLKLNPRTDNLKLFARNPNAASRNFILPEELDETAVLPIERDAEQEAAMAKKCFTCWCQNRAPPLDPMNVNLLMRFMNIEGRILPRRQTHLCAKWQRKVATTIRRAKHLGLFSYKHGRFTATDPFEASPSHEDVLDELAAKAFERLYPTEPIPSFKEESKRKSAD